MMDPNELLNSMKLPEGAAPQPVIDLDDVLKVNRKGEIVIGRDDKVDVDTFTVIVDPTSFRKGWRTWCNNADGTTRAVPVVTRPLREIPEGGLPRPPVEHTYNEKGEQEEAEWKQYNEFKMIVIDHSNGDLGRVVTFAHDSGWSRIFAHQLHSEVYARAELINAGKVANFLCPVLRFGTREFGTRGYGTHTKMTFTIVDWAEGPSENARLLNEVRAVVAGEEASQAALPAKIESIQEAEEVEKAPPKKPRRPTKPKATR